MVNGLLHALLPATALAASYITPSPSSATLQALPTSTQQMSVSTFYVVNEGDTLASIALAAYGSEDYWTVIWNDNQWIEDPDHIEVGLSLKLRSDRPGDDEVLLPELQAKLGLNVPTPTPEMRQQIMTLPQISRQTAVLPTATPTPLPQPQTQTPPPAVSGPLSEEQINFLGRCESGMTASRNSGNGYYGAFQFSVGTWNSMNTGYERADLAPIDVQIDAVQRLVQRSSIFTQFPACARKMQATGLI